jgi:LPPG:FO 2-phospho-L-lactate transferase
VVTVLAGGVGAARFLRGLAMATDPSSIVAVVNTGDDAVLHGLHVSPDIDTVVYTLASAIDPGRGWGLSDESWRTMGALARYAGVRPAGSAAGGTWFNLGDQDLATHLYRTGRLAEGACLRDVTDEIRHAWGVGVKIVPMSDDPVRTMVTVDEDVDGAAAGTEIAFQDYFVRLQHAPRVRAVRFAGAESAAPTFLSALVGPVVIAPSNPIVSIGPIRALPGVEAALAANRERTVAISPIVAGAALKGPADRMLAELGHEPSVVGVARAYAPICGHLVIDRRDEALAGAVEAEGVRCTVTDTVMSTPEVAAALGATVLGVVQ